LISVIKPILIGDEGSEATNAASLPAAAVSPGVLPNPLANDASPNGTDKPKPALVEPLTKRELEILHLVAEGLSNHEIAQEFIISQGTVKVHLSNVYGKLGVGKRTQAVAKARALGILSLT
jgi:LuxR family maltose regulon positive regulatory protein